MRKTYFVPIVVLGSLLLACGMANLVLSQVAPKYHAKADAAFKSEYESGTDYSALYQQACRLREQLSFERVDKSGFAGGTGMLLGTLLLLWAFDRRRLIQKSAQPPSENERKTT